MKRGEVASRKGLLPPAGTLKPEPPPEQPRALVVMIFRAVGASSDCKHLRSEAEAGTQAGKKAPAREGDREGEGWEEDDELRTSLSAAT